MIARVDGKTGGRPSGRGRRWAGVLGALGTGLLVVLAFPSWGHAVGLDWLVWIALVPLMLAAQGSGGRRGFFLGWAAGWVLEAAGFSWILHAIRSFTSMPLLLALLCFAAYVLYAALPWAILGLTLGKCARPRSVFWLLPFWTGLEHCFPRLFPWHLGGALYGREWLRQGADLLGTSGLSALVFLGSAAAFLWVRALWERRRPPLAPVALLVLLLSAALLYGAFRLDAVERAEKLAPELEVLLLQGAIHPLQRAEEDSLKFYLEATRAALAARRQGPPPSLIVWPESADWCPFNLTPGGDPWSAHKRLEGSPQAFWREPPPAPLVAGGVGVNERRSPRISGVAVYLQPGQAPCFYEKNVRMPFGEVVPLLHLIPAELLEKFNIPVRTIAAGSDNPLFHLGKLAFRNLICYEAVLPGYFRRAAAGADFLVNITEDAWYGLTAHIPQHVSVLVLRVVENRVPLVRATNIGPSGVFSTSGRFDHGEKLFEREVLWMSLKAAPLASLHARGGFLFPYLALATALGYWALGWWRGRQALK